MCQVNRILQFRYKYIYCNLGICFTAWIFGPMHLCLARVHVRQWLKVCNRKIAQESKIAPVLYDKV